MLGDTDVHQQLGLERKTHKALLQLVHRPIPGGVLANGETKGVNETNEHEWGEFLYLPGEKFYDFAKIRAEIIRDTELKTGKNAGMYLFELPSEPS